MPKSKKDADNIHQFISAIKEIAIQNGLEKTEDVVVLLREVFFSIFHKKFDPDAELEFDVDMDKETIKFVNNSKIVVEDGEVDDANIDIKLSDAKKIDKKIKVGDQIREEINFNDFISNQVIYQQIIQLLRRTINKSRKKIIYENNQDLVGQTLQGKIIRLHRGSVIIELSNGLEAIMDVPNIGRKFPMGERIDVYVEKVEDGEAGRGPQIIVSDGAKEIVRKRLESEIHEIREGIIEIKAIARIAGFRTKIATISHDEHIDPIGTIIGPRGSKIRAVTDRLNNEKIDIVKWDEDINKFICEAISPAFVAAIVDKPNVKNAKIIITPSQHQTLAIGKGGSNAKLASELTGVSLDIISINMAKEKNIEFELNGNLTKEEIQRIENGERIVKNNKRKNNFESNNNFSKISNDVTQEISMFNESDDFDNDHNDHIFNQIDDNDNKIENINEKLQKMDDEDDFEFNDDLEGANIDNDFV